VDDWVPVAREGEIPLDECKVVTLDDEAVAVYCLEDGYYAIRDLCTHDASELSTGEVEDGEVECCMHGAHFSIKTGEALSAPAYEPVETFPVRVVDGMIQVRDARWD
jgi:3-phenylpropionate/trans-cinnamate dioxygenase ferredoxin subunit